jgi:hypothetical protein
MDPASHRIEAKLRFGLLPTGNHVKGWLGAGTEVHCDGCDVELPPTQAEVELQFADGEILHLHRTCAEIWLALKGDLAQIAAADLERRDIPGVARHVPAQPAPSSSS